MDQIVHGIIRGNSIELPEGLHFADGQEIEVVIRLPESERSPGDGIRRTAGALADDIEWDEIMDEVQTARKLDRTSPDAP